MMPLAIVMMKGGMLSQITPTALSAPTQAQTRRTAGITTHSEPSDPFQVVARTPPSVIIEAIERSRPPTRMTRP